MSTISNVLVGVATLAIKNPYSEAKAEFSIEQAHLGTYSAKLYKDGTGNDCSTHIQITPPTGTTMSMWTAAIVNNSFYHHASAVLGNFAQMEFRFEDPNSLAWAEITAVPLQTYLGTGAWVKTTLANNTKCGYGGHTEIDTPFFVWGPLADANAVETAITALDGAACAPEDWILSRVRIELWEAAPLRTQYIDTIEIMGVTYTVEPGGTAPAMSLDPGYTEVGYTKDGITMEYNADTADIEVEEETFPLARPITKERISIKANLSESSLYNMDKAMAGASLSGSIITLGGGIQKEVSLRITGTSPAGLIRTIFVPRATATGAVGMPFKKGEETVVPVEFQALKGTGDVCQIVDNAV